MSRRVVALLLFALPASAADKTAQELAEQVKPSLCAIVTRGRDVSEKGLGTGFVVSADGLIATNAHVIGEGRPIAVEFADGQRYDAVPLVAGAVAAGQGPARAQRVGDGVPARGQDGGRRGGEPVEGGLGELRGDGGGQRAGRGWSKHAGRPWAESWSFRNPMLRPRRPPQKVQQSSLGNYCSLGIHESQSRLWENQVGRARPYWQHFFPEAQRAFPVALANVGLDEFHFAVNDVRPSFIRVEADEATYNLHIIWRFELELGLLTGDLRPADLPMAWNERFATMIGITLPEDRLGCLQDIHFSMGGLGYFPTYTLGNLYAAQFMSAARTQLPRLDEDFASGRFGRLTRWLNEKIHRPGRSYRSEDLCRQATGEGLRHDPLIQYLREKFGELYGF